MIWYKNSFLASVVSIFASVFILSGIACFTADPVMAIVLIVAGIPLLAWAKNISDNKAFKVWWKKVVDANLTPEIARNVQVAIDVYNKNPQERTLKKIAELNPHAANVIRESLKAQQAQKTK